ncbi:hypothetical protein QYF36_004753 [Acer negundo]|nr:hypothetical protein QYF36_004753 [Acer negundo]
MDYAASPPSATTFHVVAMPFPGRGHINPMMNLCKLLVLRKPESLITFVVTEEWLGYIGSDPKPDKTIPNVIPSERLKAEDFPGFYEAVMTKMEAPFEQLLDQLKQPVTAIIGDIEVRWAINLGNRRNIPVASFWTMSISFFSMLYHFDQLSQQGLAPFDLPGISSSKMEDLKTVFNKNDQRVTQLALDCISRVPKSQYLLFTSIYELELQVTNTLRETLPFPVYTVGPSIPYLELKHSPSGNNTIDNKDDPDYIQWLDLQPGDSVLQEYTESLSFNILSDMNLVTSETTTVRHVVAMPYPGRSHINSIMNLCRLLISKTDDKLILITFVVTEEWLHLMRSEPKPDKIYFASIPNIIPSEVGRAADINGFLEAVLTKMEAPFEQLLDRIKPQVTLIMCDSILFWAVGVGNRRHIPVASFWPMSATMFSIFQHWDLLVQNKHYPVDLLEMGNEHVEYIPGVSPTRLMDFPSLINGSDPHILQRFYDIVSWVSKAQYLLFSSIYELERRTIDALRAKFCFPIYTIGPAIPFFKLEDNSCLSPEKINEPNYMHWLNCQPNRSVLYISFGSSSLFQMRKWMKSQQV